MELFVGTRQLRVLLVEDNEGDTTLISHLLRGATHDEVSMSHVDRVTDAVSELRDRAFDVVLLDLNLVDISGTDAVSTTVTAAGRVPVVVLTGLDEELARRCLEAGAEDYVTKNGLDRNTLLRSIDHAMSRAKTKALAIKLQHSQRLAAIGQLAAGVAHEVNNPAASMLLNLEALGRDVETVREAIQKERADVGSLLPQLEEMERIIEETVDSVTRIAAVTKDLKLLSRGNALARMPVSVHDVCRSAIQLVRPEMGGAARVTLDLEEVTIETDRSTLLQVVVHLLQNAVQSLGGGPDDFISLRLERWSHGAKLTVANVPQIPPRADS